MKAIIYLRTSSEEQNPENQLKDCMDLAKKLKLDTFEKYLEDRQSAFKDVKRPSFELLKKLIKKGKIDNLIVWDFDRVYRNRIKFKNFLSFLKHYKVKLHSVRQDWIEDINKVPEPWNEIIYDMLIQVIGWLAEEESKKKSERVKIAIRKKCLNCKKINDYNIEKCVKCGGTKFKLYSRKGNKWGKKGLSKKTIEWVRKLRKQNKSYTEICQRVYYWDKSGNKKFITRGAVSKILNRYKEV